MSPTLRADGVEVAIGGRAILGGVDLAVEEGERVALIGANGAGKTTFLETVLGLRAPSAGTCRVLGAPPPAAGVGYVAQDPAVGLLPWYSGRDNVLLPLRCRGAGADERRRALSAVRERLDPDADLDLGARPPNLSGGQRQLVGLMRALVSSPRLLVLDEPFSAMDAPSRVRLRAALRAHAEAEGRVATLFTTHDLDDMLELASRVVMIGGAPARIIASFDPRGADARRDVEAALREAHP